LCGDGQQTQTDAIDWLLAADLTTHTEDYPGVHLDNLDGWLSGAVPVPLSLGVWDGNINPTEPVDPAWLLSDSEPFSYT
jgi:hypothetical protein